MLLFIINYCLIHKIICLIQILIHFFKESENNVRASLRGRSYADMAKAASKFGGGGHTLAAGCTFTGMTLEEAEKAIIPVLIDTVNAR